MYGASRLENPFGTSKNFNLGGVPSYIARLQLYQQLANLGLYEILKI